MLDSAGSRPRIKEGSNAGEVGMVSELIGISGIGPATVKLLEEQGVHTVEDLAAMDLEQLLALPGFGAVRAARILAVAAEIIAVEADDEDDVTLERLLLEGTATSGKKKKKTK